MCHFVMLGVKGSENSGILAAELKALSRPMWLYEGLTLPNGLLPYATTHFCDCGTDVGGLYRPIRSELAVKKTEAKLRKQGWKESRITRWRSEMEASTRQKQEDKAHRQGAGPTECDEILKVVERSMVQGVPEVGVVLHWADPNTPNVISKLKPVPFAQFGKDDLLELEEETLLLVTSNSKKR